jgi:UPF0755 protein
MKKILLIIILIILLVSGYFAWLVFGPNVNAPTNKYLYIKNTDNYEAVLNKLTSEGIIKPNFVWNKLIDRAKYKSNIKPGRYEIKAGTSMYALVKTLKAGKQTPVKFTINKLRLKEQLAAKIAASFDTDSITVINFLNNPDSLANYGLDSNTVMTAVIPNTYDINWNNSPKKIFTRLFDEQKKFWNETRIAKAKAKNLTAKQAYIIASIVEEETNASSDKPLIASVYTNRFNKGEKLQADPTVKFAMKDFGLKRILYKHLEYASPYNTYRNVGLPPGPICTPSTKTIDAVLDAPQTDYMFFVAKPDLKGYSNFATNYQQHQIYAKQYQQALDSLIRAKQQANQNQ